MKNTANRILAWVLMLMLLMSSLPVAIADEEAAPVVLEIAAEEFIPEGLVVEEFVAEETVVEQPDAITLSRPVMGAHTVISSLQLKLTWEAVSGAQGYELWRSDAADGTYVKVADTTALEKVDDCIFGKINYYKVRAYADDNGTRVYSAFSVYRSSFGLATAGIRSLEARQDGVLVTASTVANGTGYYIYRCESQNGLYERLGTTTLSGGSNTFLDTTAEAGKTYYYKCRVYHISYDNVAEGVTYVGPFSVAKSVTAGVCNLARPTMGLSYVISSTSLRLTWESVRGADGYELWRSDAADGAYTKVGETTALELTDTKCLFGRINYYKVRAYETTSGGGRLYSQFSVYRTCFGLSTPGVQNMQDTKYGVVVTTATVANATGYYIYRCERLNGTYERLGTTTLQDGVNTYLDGTAQPGKVYYYKCRAYYVSETGVTYVGPFSVGKRIELSGGNTINAQARLNKWYVARTYTSFGQTMDASLLGAEYGVYFRADHTCDFKIAGMTITNLQWTEEKVTIEGTEYDAFCINYYGTVFKAVLTADGFDLDFYGTMTLHFVAAD